MFKNGSSTTPWARATRDALLSGSAASALSTVVLAVRGRSDTGRPAAPTNATSHWIWGERATREDRPSLRHTALGYVIHHAASVFWAMFYERWFGRACVARDVPTVLAGSAGVAALAAFVDFRLTPERLTPGYEKRLSRSSLVAVYGAFAAGLAISCALRRR